MTRCQECNYDWVGPPQQVITTIAALPTSVSRLLTGIGIADASGQLRTRPAAVTWSPLEYLAHTSDAIDWYAHRINRLLTENRPTFEPFDWDAHTVSQRYRDRHLDDVLDVVKRSCARLAAVLAGLTAADWKREGTGSDGQPRTITQLAHRAAHEAQHHLHDIQIGLSANTCGQDP